MDLIHILIILLTGLVAISQIVGFVLMVRSVRDVATIQRAIFLFMRQRYRSPIGVREGQCRQPLASALHAPSYVCLNGA